MAWRQAWWTAARQAGVDIKAELDEILADDQTPGGKTPEQVWAAMVDWAAQTKGCRIEFHDKPVMQ